jgi:hypothetical protein
VEGVEGFSSCASVLTDSGMHVWQCAGGTSVSTEWLIPGEVE